MGSINVAIGFDQKISESFVSAASSSPAAANRSPFSVIKTSREGILVDKSTERSADGDVGSTSVAAQGKKACASFQPEQTVRRASCIVHTISLCIGVI